jgi:DNA polymerase-1
VKTHLLIDGDVVAFSSAAAAQKVVEGEDGWVYPMAHKAEGEAIVENALWSLKTGLGADSFEVILTDPADNWRFQVDPSYKGNRTGERPLLLGYLKDYLRERHGAYHWAGLEADDVLSIKMTTPPGCDVCGGDCASANPQPVFCGAPPRLICVGRDKDFKSIPGLHHTWKDLDARGKPIVREVTQWEADRWHLIQTLAGDAVDGFKGCPGLGMKRAAEIIDSPHRLTAKEGVITRGINKGQKVTKWVAEPTRDYWEAVVSQYRKVGQGAEEALVSARLARLLRFGEYDPETEELTLWTPEMLRGVGQ